MDILFRFSKNSIIIESAKISYIRILCFLFQHFTNLLKTLKKYACFEEIIE